MNEDEVYELVLNSIAQDQCTDDWCYFVEIKPIIFKEFDDAKLLQKLKSLTERMVHCEFDIDDKMPVVIMAMVVSFLCPKTAKQYEIRWLYGFDSAYGDNETPATPDYDEYPVWTLNNYK